ncbi:MAG: hypothetical protein BM563_05170 [Bacteroidetes bacterium MedPE-SWsnd-G1]|nr:MAG: hypothetical protein BM563_05170 [Bacteroidetes bacterium MedPE-SWsnd-G1]
MKKAILIFGLVSLTVLTSAFQGDATKVSANKENCYRTNEFSTVLTLEESNKFSEVPFIGNSFIGFREAVGFKESRNRYHIVNKFGYLGKYQFGKSTLKRLKIYNVENFLKNPETQERAFKALCSLNKHILRKDIKRSVGKTINGIEITESGILAAAHLSGAGNVKKYLRSNGGNNLSDAFGTSIEYYMTKFSGYDVSWIDADKNPVV